MVLLVVCLDGITAGTGGVRTTSHTPRKITSTASARNSRRYRDGNVGTSVSGDVAHQPA